MLNKKKILIVEDNEPIRNIIALFLKKQGYETELAKNGKEGVMIIKASRENFNLIISDIDMPEMNGIEMARNINKNIPIIFISGSMDSLEKAQKANFPNFIGRLLKPFRFEILLKTVKLVFN